jgi:hypothetical protein
MIGALLACTIALAEPAPPPALVAFSSSDGIARLERSKAKLDFFALADQFEPQMNAGFCGPTTAVVVLNALRIDNDKIEKPFDKSAVPDDVLPPPTAPKGFDPFVHRYTQRAFFDDKMTPVKTREVYYGKPASPGAKPDFGMQIRQLGRVLSNHGLDVQVRIVDDKLDEAAAKREIVENLARAGDFVIVNFSRPIVGQKGGGHISPLGAYDDKSDSFLLLDVNPVEGKRWSWVDAKTLFAAMRTKDHDENRGFLLVREGAAATASTK